MCTVPCCAVLCSCLQAESLRQEARKASTRPQRSALMSRAAEVFVSIDLLEQGANCYREAGRHSQAADLYSQIGKHGSAAEQWEAVLDWERAADSWRLADKLSKSVRAYKKVCEYLPVHSWP